jgi:hypothetical protein
MLAPQVSYRQPRAETIENLDFLFVRFAKVVCLSLPNNVAWLDLVR